MALWSTLDIGYGYDVFQNSGTLKSDLKNLASSVRSDLSDEQAIQAVKDLIDSHKVLLIRLGSLKQAEVSILLKL